MKSKQGTHKVINLITNNFKLCLLEISSNTYLEQTFSAAMASWRSIIDLVPCNGLASQLLSNLFPKAVTQ